MSWDDDHTASERLASEAERAARAGLQDAAALSYRRAAESETRALTQLSPDKPRTRGITSVSAVALWYKAHAYPEAEHLAHRCLADGGLPTFAEAQIRELLTLIWTTRSAEAAGVKFVPGDVLVSVKGGQVVHGGAPLDLIVQKVEGIQAILLRTVEMLVDRPFRKRGSPSADIQQMFKPWLFQAPAGSYQFAVRVQEPPQLDLWRIDRPQLSQITDKFFQVLQASATDPENQLQTVVPNKDYRDAFLSIVRNLAPTGTSFERLDVRDAGSPGSLIASFEKHTRQELNVALRRAKPAKGKTPGDVPDTIRGMLRALHLDQDWLEVASVEDPVRRLRIDQAGDALDDVVGPMVNKRVTVKVIRRGTKLLYQDIELEE